MNWHDAKTDPPKESGTYLVWSSKSRRAYQCHWWVDGPSGPGHWSQKSRNKFITHWAEMPPGPEEVIP